MHLFPNLLSSSFLKSSPHFNEQLPNDLVILNFVSLLLLALSRCKVNGLGKPIAIFRYRRQGVIADTKVHAPNVVWIISHDVVGGQAIGSVETSGTTGHHKPNAADIVIGLGLNRHVRALADAMSVEILYHGGIVTRIPKRERFHKAVGCGLDAGNVARCKDQILTFRRQRRSQ
jgi:hypothetical protein